MDIKHLQYFQHLASSLNFSKTAAAVFVSPPTLTRIISKLEDECGEALFVRNNRNVELTANGRKFLAFAESTLTNYHALRAEMASQKGSVRGELSLYCSVTAAQTYLPTILDNMRLRFPGVNIQLDTGDHVLALNRIMEENEQQVDISIAILTPNFPSAVQFQKIDTVPLTLIVPLSMDINNKAALKWQEHDVIMPALGPSKRIIHHWFAEHNIRPRVYASVSGNEAIVSMVALGLGIGFVPQIVLENSSVKHKVKELKVEDIEAYQLGLCYLKSRQNDELIRSVRLLFEE